jgi:anti-repressor protein
MHEIITNTFQNSKIRIIIINNQPWFVAKDVAKVLGYTRKDGRVDTNAMIRKLFDDDILEIADDFESSSNMSRKLAVLNESGLYNSIFSSKLQTAKVFKKWVTKEVLPSIRQTGSYSLQTENKAEFDFEKIQKVVKIGVEFLNEFDNLNPVKQIKLDTFVKQKTGESLLEDFGISFENHYFLPTEIGNMIGMSGAEINLILEKKGFQFRDENGVWKPTSSGKEFCLEIGNKFNQLKWRISTIL